MRSRCPAPSFLALCFVFRAFAFSRAQTGRLRNYCRTDIEVAALPLITNYNGPQLLVPHFAFASCVCAFTVLLPRIFPIPLIVYSSHMQIGGSCCPRLHQHRAYCHKVDLCYDYSGFCLCGLMKNMLFHFISICGGYCYISK